MIDPYDSVVVSTTCRVLIPFAQVFALYVLFHGHESPGGGFQGGAILGATVILARFTTPRAVSLRYLPGMWAIRVGALGVLIYGLVGLLPVAFGGTFLDYGRIPLPWLPTAEIRALGILGVEIGVAVGVAGVMVSIFDDLAPNPSPPVPPQVAPGETDGGEKA
jgi:multicomponent Na+:H+ antiporter subunit B